MKYLVLIFILFSIRVSAENWYPIGRANSFMVFMKKQTCESYYSQTCFDITGKDIRKWKQGTVDSKVTLVPDVAGTAAAKGQDDAIELLKQNKILQRQRAETWCRAQIDIERDKCETYLGLN